MRATHTTGRLSNPQVLGLALALCAAVACVCAVDPFIDDQQHRTTAPIEQPTPTASAPPKSLQSAPEAKPSATGQPAPTRPLAPAPAPADAPKPGEAAVPRAKAAGEAAVPVPVATGPAKRVVSSPALNITAVPTAAPAPVKRGEAVETKKTGGAALFDVKAGGTHVAISPSGDVMIRNPDVDVNTIRVIQMIAGIVQAVKRVVESAKPAHHKEPADLRKAGGKEHENANKDDDDDENEKESKDNGKGAALVRPAAVVVKQRVTIVAPAGDDGADADGAAPLSRMEPIPRELADDSSISSAQTRPFLRRDNLVDDAKPYARKLHYRVRRDYRGDGSVGNVQFDRFNAPITMQLQTIPSAEFAPDSYRFAVDVVGRPTFFVDIPRSS